MWSNSQLFMSKCVWILSSKLHRKCVYMDGWYFDLAVKAPADSSRDTPAVKPTCFLAACVFEFALHFNVIYIRKTCTLYSCGRISSHHRHTCIETLTQKYSETTYVLFPAIVGVYDSTNIDEVLLTTPATAVPAVAKGVTVESVSNPASSPSRELSIQ